MEELGKNRIKENYKSNGINKREEEQKKIVQKKKKNWIRQKRKRNRRGNASRK